MTVAFLLPGTCLPACLPEGQNLYKKKRGTSREGNADWVEVIRRENAKLEYPSEIISDTFYLGHLSPRICSRIWRFSPKLTEPWSTPTRVASKSSLYNQLPSHAPSYPDLLTMQTSHYPEPVISLSHLLILDFHCPQQQVYSSACPNWRCGTHS